MSPPKTVVTLPSIPVKIQVAGLPLVMEVTLKTLAIIRVSDVNDVGEVSIG